MRYFWGRNEKNFYILETGHLSSTTKCDSSLNKHCLPSNVLTTLRCTNVNNTKNIYVDVTNIFIDKLKIGENKIMQCHDQFSNLSSFIKQNSITKINTNQNVNITALLAFSVPLPKVATITSVYYYLFRYFSCAYTNFMNIFFLKIYKIELYLTCFLNIFLTLSVNLEIVLSVVNSSNSYL